MTALLQLLSSEIYQVQSRNWLHDCSCIFWLKTPVSQFSNFAPHCVTASYELQPGSCNPGVTFSSEEDSQYLHWLLTDIPKVAILGWVRLFNSTIIFEQFRQLAVAAKSCINVQICKIKTNIEIIMQKLATVTVSSYLWGEIKLEDTAQRCLLMVEVMTAAEWACAHYAEIPIITGFVPATINSDRVQIWSPVQHLHHVTTGHICPSHLTSIQSSSRTDTTGAQ